MTTESSEGGSPELRNSMTSGKVEETINKSVNESKGHVGQTGQNSQTGQTSQTGTTGQDWQTVQASQTSKARKSSNETSAPVAPSKHVDMGANEANVMGKRSYEKDPPIGRFMTYVMSDTSGIERVHIGWFSCGENISKRPVDILYNPVNSDLQTVQRSRPT